MAKNQSVSLRLESTPVFHIPGMMRYIEHMYKSDPTKAIELANEMFNSAVSSKALHDILSGNRQPLFIQSDLDDDSMSYVFDLNEVNVEILKSFQSADND